MDRMSQTVCVFETRLFGAVGPEGTCFSLLVFLGIEFSLLVACLLCAAWYSCRFSVFPAALVGTGPAIRQADFDLPPPPLAPALGRFNACGYLGAGISPLFSRYSFLYVSGKKFPGTLTRILFWGFFASGCPAFLHAISFGSRQKGATEKFLEYTCFL